MLLPPPALLCSRRVRHGPRIRSSVPGLTDACVCSPRAVQIMTNGPIEVAFYVYGDFESYKGGIYKRSAKDDAPEGGHAVKCIGWGEGPETDTETGEPVEYWLIANSWSPAWGEDGFFRIERGTNECGIETQPAAGMPDTASAAP